MNLRIRTMSSGEIDSETGQITIEKHTRPAKKISIAAKRLSKRQVTPVAKCQYPTETKQLLADKLREFNKEVTSFSRKDALAQAQARCPELLDDKFKLRFLRTEILDVKRAARRYIRYWELRVRLFGDRSFQPLTLTEDEDVAALRSGVVQIVPGHERVLQIDTSFLHNAHFSVDSLARCQWYVFHKALEQSEDIQRYGGVFTINLHGTFQSMDLLKHISERANDGFPLRCASACIINPPRFAGTLVKIAKIFLRPRVRDKIHVIGNEEEFKRHVGFSPEEIGAAEHDHSMWVDHMLRLDRLVPERMSL